MTATIRVARPPGPRGRPLFGNTIDYDKDRIGFLRRCQAEYGDVFAFDRDTVVVCHPDLVHDLLNRTNDDFLEETVPLAVRGDPERIATDARSWTEARRRAWRGLNRAMAEAHATRLHDVFAETIGGAGGREVDVLHVMKAFFGRATVDFCLGRDAAGMPDVLAENAAAIDPLSTSSQLFPPWYPARRVRRFLRARERTLTAITQVIRGRRSTGSADDAPRDLLDVLLAVRDPELTELQVQRLLRGIMLASYGVPATTLTWIVYALASYPEARRRVGTEAVACAEPVPPAAALPYTQAFIKEVLRLWPPTWLVGRTARRGTELGGWHIDRGDQVMFSMYLLHRDPRWWSDPDRFDPERWLAGQAPHRRHAYLPFGAGPRVCLGTQLGMTQLSLATCWLMRDFTIRVPAAGVHVVPDFRGLLAPRGLTVGFEPKPEERPQGTRTDRKGAIR